MMNVSVSYEIDSEEGDIYLEHNLDVYEINDEFRVLKDDNSYQSISLDEEVERIGEEFKKSLKEFIVNKYQEVKDNIHEERYHEPDEDFWKYMW